jgi:hypothetical protein
LYPPTHPPITHSADDLETPYTNYTSGYKALLDYVWYDPQRLTVTAQLPQPSEQLLASFIPSPNFPSDHLAVVYDLAFKPQPSAAAAAAAAGGSATAAGSSGSSEPVRHVTGDFTLLPASEDHVGDAVAALQAGQVIALPTDTLYGLAAAAGGFYGGGGGDWVCEREGWAECGWIFQEILFLVYLALVHLALPVCELCV